MLIQNMARHYGIFWIVCIGVFICRAQNAGDEEPPASETENNDNSNNPVSVPQQCKDETDHVNCSNNDVTYLLVANVHRTLFIADNFSRAFCTDKQEPGLGKAIYLQLATFPMTIPRVRKKMLELKSWNGTFLLHLAKWHTRKNVTISLLREHGCSELLNRTSGECPSKERGTCHVRCWKPNEVCIDADYDEKKCLQIKPKDNSAYFVFVDDDGCLNCNNPVKQAEREVDMSDTMAELPQLPESTEEPLDPATAVHVMGCMNSDYVDQFNESTVALTLGKSITGVLRKQDDPLDMEEVSFAYTNNTEDFKILDERTMLSQFSRSISVSKEAFQKALDLNISTPFAAVFRFLNLSKDEQNSTVLGDEVIAIEMGAKIQNLTDTINIHFSNMNYKGVPSCYSWGGNGSRPVWTNAGCETLRSGENITCRCTHMTFFAVLLTPLNETISTDDLNTLTIITRVGCGLSMFFLGIVLFMHFVLRRATSSNSTKILIHLALATFLLDFAFLVNDSVAKTKNVIGCKIMAAAMHYFMLSTFSWYAVHAFHLCLQLYHHGQIKIRRYVLKVAITSWVLPSVIGIVLLSIGKYGEVTVTTGDAASSVSMCWILDNDVHYFVNISYYALVFLFTFSTFIIMLTWLCRMTKIQKAAAQVSSCQKIVTIMGLCCVLGVTWGCAFFAYGIFRLPAYYCFTVLNSFQGLCLFIYYYKTSSMVETPDPDSSSSGTLKTDLDVIFNPYENLRGKPKPE